MTDTNELRRLAQAATKGPWVSQGRYIGTPRHMSYIGEVRDQCGNWSDTEKSRSDAAYIAAANPTTINELLNRIEAAESDAVEQARLNGMGASREAALMAKLEAAEKDRDALRAENEALATNLRGKHSITGATYAHLIAERDALRARIEAMEKQEPVAWVDAKEEGYEFYGISYLPVGKHHLYAAPVSAEAIRAEALEEAAKWCEAKQSYNAMHANTEFAAAIRSLKEKP